MSGSVVFYRFKAQKDPSTIHFEGTGISVWDLKKDILAENKLGKGADFDFAIYNADTNDEYSDDKAIIPRSTSVIARRLPPSKPGRGNAQYYMVSSSSAAPSAGSSSSAAGLNGAGRGSGAAAVRGHVSRRFDGKETSPVKSSSSNSQPVIATTASTGADEAARIAAMLATTSEQWKDTQEQMSTATPVFYGNRRPGMGGARPAHASLAPEKPVPPGYVCYRCGQPGHWIQDCPTNDKPEWENKPRIKRTTGIPKSFLQTVEGPGKDGENQAGMMITADGSFVVARPDAASWDKHRAVQANLTSSDIQNSAPTDPDLVCPLCSRLLRDAVKTGCCSTSYCEECIHNYLSENDFVCPECESKIKSLKNLTKDEDRRERAKKYLEDTLKASKATADAEKTKENGSDAGDGLSAGEGALSAMPNSSARDGKRKEGTPTGPPEEGELGRDGQAVGKGRSQSPRSTRAGSVARSDAGSAVGNGTKGQSNSGSTNSAQSANGNAANANGGGGMMQSNMNQMNTMFNNFNSNFGNSMPPQLQMVQNQLQQTMNILSSPSLPPQMRMQLLGQLQGLQYQYAQLTQMMGAGAFGGGGPNMQQQLMMAQRMQQMQHMQQMMMLQQQQQMYNAQNGNGMMQQNGFHGNGGWQQQQQQQQQGGPLQQRNRPQPGVQYEEDSADSPYMRVPVNPKFKQGLKRERPEDFVEIGNQPIRRM